LAKKNNCARRSDPPTCLKKTPLTTFEKEVKKMSGAFDFRTRMNTDKNAAAVSNVMVVVKRI
jgi:hypothetical protein